jgi:uncharacterized protein (DUF983 family)
MNLLEAVEQANHHGERHDIGPGVQQTQDGYILTCPRCGERYTVDKLHHTAPLCFDVLLEVYA